MSAAPTFSAARSTAWIHYALVEPDPRSAVLRRIVWLAPEGAAPPVAVSLAETWRIGGVYVFLGRPAPNDAALLARLRSWVTGAPAGARLVWLRDPSAPVGDWDPVTVRVRKLTQSGGSVAARTGLGAGGYAVTLDQGCEVAVREGDASFAFGAESSGVRLEVPAGEAVPVTGAATVQLRGPDAGAVAFAVDSAGAGGGGALLDALDAGIRYYHPADGSGAGEDEPLRGVASIRYPVFDPGEASFTLRGLIDPGEPASARAGLVFAPETPPLGSHFRTTTGEGLALTPLDGAGLRFLRRGLAAGEQAADRLTLAPAGPFALTAGDAADLLCGTAGVEYVGIPATGATVRFVPGLPAWAPLFDPDGVLNDEMVDAPRLEPVASTSWVAVEAEQPVQYFAQPRDAVLHAPGGDGFLDYFPVPAGSVPAAGDGAGSDRALPMVPYGGVDAGSAAAAAAYEVEVLAPERRERVFALAPASHPVMSASRAVLADAETVTAVTPGGYIATFGAGGEEWIELELARLGDDRLALEAIRDPLRAALLTSDQFMVVSDPTSLAGHLDANARVVLDGWTFDLHPGEWARHGTILVLKSCDRPLAELVADVGTWAIPDAFNRSPASTQRELEAIIEAARARAAAGDGGSAPDPGPWTAFVRDVVDDADWNGWLAFRCPVPPGSLPPELRDLAAGIDEDRFSAHHLGLHQTPVPPTGEPPQDSALFGLIAYEDAPRDPTGRDHAFQVTSVEVSFAASAVRSFSARIALTMGRIFGAPAQLDGTPGPPVLRLDGTLQRRGDRDVYVFRTASESTLRLQDRVLETVRITRCELGSPTGRAGDDGFASDGDATVARFALRGSLSFLTLPSHDGDGIDLLGYHDLPFSGLSLEMRFDPAAPHDADFRLDVSGMEFDPASAEIRPGSLPDRFPVRPRGMTSSDSADRPADLGWSTVAVPALDAGAPAGEWLALVFDLDLGTPGALADAAGLSAGIALIWSPSDRRTDAMMGLRLPGASSGAAGVSLMGVLDLDVHQQRLLGVDDGYLLKLTGINLRFLGRALPPDGTFDVLLFGDPEGGSGAGPLGWYGAYRRTDESEEAEEQDRAAGGRLRGVAAGRDIPGLLERGGEDAPPPAWWGRPWAWTLIQSTEDEP